MIILILLLLCVVFIELFIALNILPNAKSMFELSRRSVSVLRSSKIEDDDKEAFARRTSLQLLKITGSVVLKFSAILVVLYLLSLVAVSLLSISMEKFIGATFSIPILLLMTLVSVGYLRFRHGVSR